MGDKTFTIFLGTYNGEKWVSDSINYLERQDAKPFDVVIIDNGSTDKTVPIIQKKLKEADLVNNYKLIVNESNIGAIATFLDRLELFNSEWIIMVHQDDVYLPNYISTLKSAIENVSSETSIIFSAMRRIDEKNQEILSPPTLASKLSEKDRFQNLLLSIQLQPVNFPACAMKTSSLNSIQTSRHTTAFNDTEMILKLLCVSDIKYVAEETVFYRVHQGNASNITSTNASDYSVFIGLIEFINSKEFNSIVTTNSTDENFKLLINAFANSIKIRIINEDLQKVLSYIIAERLIRQFGYKYKSLVDFLCDSMSLIHIPNSLQIIKNLHSRNEFTEININDISSIEQSMKSKEEFAYPKSSLLNSFINLIPLKSRERFFDFAFNSQFLARSKRPFVKVWRSMNRREK